MRLSKISTAVLLSLSVSLAGCGGGGDGTPSPSTPTPTPTTPTPTPTPTASLSVATPIADMKTPIGTEFDFSIPSDTCTAASGVAIDYKITSLKNGSGLSLINFNQLKGTPSTPGTVEATLTCSTSSESKTDSFTITIEDANLDPQVSASAPESAKTDETVSLKAAAQDGNASGSIANYLWEQTGGPDVTLTDADKENASFVVTDAAIEGELSFKVTVTDNDGSTASDTVTVNLLSKLAPVPSITFPFAFGSYSSETLDITGLVEADAAHPVENITVSIGDVELPATITGNKWRVTDATIDKDVTIKVTAKSSTGISSSISKDIKLERVYATDIEDEVIDIAFDSKNNIAYVQTTGFLVSDTKLLKYDLSGESNSEIKVTQDNDFPFSAVKPTSITYNPKTNSIVRSYAEGVSVINLSTGHESLLSNSDKGAGDAFQTILDLTFNESSSTLYVADNKGELINVDTISGDRTKVADVAFAASIIASKDNSTIYANGYSNIGSIGSLFKLDNSITPVPVVALDQTTLNGPVSDLALNETENVVYFVDQSGSISRLDLTTQEITSSFNNHFRVENLNNINSARIGLNYDDERGLLTVVGESNLNGTPNAMYVIEVKSGDFSLIAGEN